MKINHWHILGLIYIFMMIYIGVVFMYNLGQAPWIDDNSFWNQITGIIYLTAHFIGGYAVFFRRASQQEKEKPDNEEEGR